MILNREFWSDSNRGHRQLIQKKRRKGSILEMVFVAVQTNLRWTENILSLRRKVVR